MKNLMAAYSRLVAAPDPDDEVHRDQHDLEEDVEEEEVERDEHADQPGEQREHAARRMPRSCGDVWQLASTLSGISTVVSSTITREIPSTPTR